MFHRNNVLKPGPERSETLPLRGALPVRAQRFLTVPVQAFSIQQYKVFPHLVS